jgi:hypothetical protein
MSSAYVAGLPLASRAERASRSSPAPFDEAVGVEHECLALLEAIHCVAAVTEQRSERRRAPLPEEASAAVGRDDEGRRMAGAGVPDPSVAGIELDVRERRRRRRRHGLHEGVEPLEQLRRARRLGEGADGAPELPHRHGRIQAVPDDVPDDERHGAGGQSERVVPVTPDLEGRRTRPIRRRDSDVLERRRAAAEEAELQRV